MAREMMSDARLAEIEKRWREREYGQMDISGRHRIASASGAWNYWITNAAVDEGELLAEVERLRAREAALMEVVQAVAEAGIDVSERPDASYLCFDGMERADELQAEARTLLADADKREKGNDDGKY